MKNYLKTAAMAVVLCVGSAAGAATIVNGSLTGPLANAGVPTGWLVSSPSPDTNNVSAAAGIPGSNYAIAPNNSPDGGTWIGIARDGPGFVESFYQNVTDFVAGQSYTLSWSAGNFGFGAGGYTGLNAIELLLDGVGIGSGAVLGLNANWFQQSVNFTATATSHSVGFRLLNNTKSYMQIDGVGIVAAVPIPASFFMLSLGLGGLASLRRRRNKKA